MTTDPTPPLLVLHPPGHRRGGRPWRAQFMASRWPGDVFAPDLPGHGDADPPLGGNHEQCDAAIVAARVDTGDSPVVVGIGGSGWGAQLFALGGRAAGLVLVDGLGAPWLDAAGRVATTRQHLRNLFEDRSAMEPPVQGVPDSRINHLFPGHGDRALAQRALTATEIPVLVLASDGSAAPLADSRQLVDDLANPATSIEVAAIRDTEPSSIAAVVAAWWIGR